MWYPMVVTQAPETAPLTLDEVKRRLRIDFSDDDEDIGLLIAAAQDHVEKYCGILLSRQTVQVKCDSWRDFEELPVSPVVALTSISYVSPSGDAAEFTDVELRADGLEASIALSYGSSWPAMQPGSRITVVMDAGFSDTPAAIKHAMLLHIADAYENRENSKAEGWTAFDALLSNYRR